MSCRSHATRDLTGSTSRGRSLRGLAALPMLWLGLAAAEDQATVEFMRVHAPPGRVQEVPLDTDRYVPMSILEFDRAVAARDPAGRAAPAPRVRAEAARYEARLDGRGRLVGTMAFEVAAAGDLGASFLPLGDVDVEGGTVRTSAGVGQPVFFGLPDGSAAVRTPGPGSYTCAFACRPVPGGTRLHRLPLVPALATSLTLRVEPGVRPLVIGSAIVARREAALDADGLVAWRIETGPAPAVTFRLDAGAAVQRVRSWTEVGVRGRRADVVTRFEPEHGWNPGTLTLALDAGLEPTAVQVAAREAGDGEGELVWRFGAGRALLIDVPASLAGSRAAIVVAGIAPVAGGRLQEIPFVRLAPAIWAGGGFTLTVNPEFAVERIEPQDAVPVGQEIAARWPAAGSQAASAGQPADAGARMHFELQSATAVIAASVGPRPVELDVARVTTVEISPQIVLGRSACEVRVSAGEAFEATAAVGAGWLIDGVEAISAPQPVPDAAAGGAAIPVEWRRLGTGGNGELRIAFAEAVTRNRSVNLRISGHRAGIPMGAAFATADMDMVRFAGESTAAIDFRTGSDTLVEIDGTTPAAALDARLAALAEPGPTQGRATRGKRSASRAARLVQRRSPLDADVLVELTARDGQLTESLSATCRTRAGDIDSVVVHVSEHLGEQVQWTRTDARGGAILARRLEGRDPARGESGSLPVVAESWLLEFTPAALDAVSFRGVRSVEFTGPRPVPLAWVEAATTPQGILRVRGEGVARPRLLNRGLRELPPDGEREVGSIGEFAYGDPRSMLGDDRKPPAELSPPDPAAARAWAWRQTTSCWAYASGRVEWETTFDLQNQGRALVAVTVPAGLSVEAISIDGISTPFDGGPTTGGEVNVPLPARRGRVAVAIRGTAARVPRLGSWRIDPVTCVLDAPVLERRLRVMLPPGLDLAVPTADAEPGWVDRLFAASTRSRPEAAASTGFRPLEIAEVDPRSAGGIVVVRSRTVAAVGIVAGLAATAAAFGAARRWPGAAATCVVGLVIAALWLPAPVAFVARAAWWGGATGLTCGWFNSRRWLVTACVAIAAGGGIPMGRVQADAAAASPPAPGPAAFRVLVAPGGDPAAVLVPEPLFRLLAADEFAAAAAVRVVECRAVPLGPTVDAPWRVTIDVDADLGGVLVLDQSPCGSRWSRPVSVPRGVVVSVAEGGSQARLAASAAGRHRVILDLDPAVAARGAVESATFCLPPAARGTVVPPRVATLPAAQGWHCDRADRVGPWLPATVTGMGEYDVSRATRVRLVHPADPRWALVERPRQAVSDNDVEWREDGCIVKAAFEVGGENEIVRAVVVRHDAGLIPVVPPGKQGISAYWPLGDERLLVEFPRPVPGRTRVELEFSKAFPNPVGVFDVPSAWLEGVAADTRTVRLSAANDLDIEPMLPGGVSLLRLAEEDEPRIAAAWRVEVQGPPAGGSAAGAESPGRVGIGVVRRPRQARGIQSLVVGFASDATTLELACEFEAAQPLTVLPIVIPPRAVLDRATVTVATADGPPTPVDLVTSRPAPDRLLVVPQRPRAGRFSALVELRLAGPPPAQGRLPLARAAFLGETPLDVTWRSDPGRRVVVGGDDAAVNLRQIAIDDRPPEYSLAAASVPDEPAGLPAADHEASSISVAANVVVAAEIRLAADGRGRARCRARFDVITPRTFLDVVLPPGMRLFDVLVDGHEAEAEPLGGDAWRVPLNVASWPHALILTYAGDTGGAPASGDPIRLLSPRLVEFERHETLWTIDAPDDLTLRVAEPGRLIEAAELDAIRSAARQRLVAGYEAAVATVGPAEAERLERLVARWEKGDPRATEAAGEAVAPERRERVCVLASDGAVTVRGVRRSDASSPARGLATVVAAGLLATGWSIARRWPKVVGAAVHRAWPLLLVAAGAGWTALLAPALPGWVMIAVGCAAAARPGAPRHGAAVAGDATIGSTRVVLRG